MATYNAAATLQQAGDHATNYASATLTIFDGLTTLATHTVPSWTASNSGNNGLATAAAISDVTIAGDGTADRALLVKGSSEIELTVGTSGADVIVNSTNYVTGGTSQINSFVVTFPA